MSSATWGALLGLTGSVGILLVVTRALASRHTAVEVRVLPYLRDLPQAATTIAPTGGTGILGALMGPALRSMADRVEQILGGSASVKRRLERADLGLTVQEFRVQQVVWGTGAFAVFAVIGTARSLSDPTTALSSLMLCLLALVSGVLARDWHLTNQATTREREILLEFPAIAELLALSVAAGEGPVAALDRVVRRSGGELSSDLGKVLANIRTGTPVGQAFDDLAAVTGLPLVARFALGVAIAVERGTPLSDVLHAQAADVREAGRRSLIETAARKEVLMMIPVVFLVLPITVLFAFYPGAIGLSMTTP